MNIIDAIHDPNLFRPFLADANDSIETWANWSVALKALHGLKVNKAERHIFTECTGRTKLRRGGFQTGLFLTGRRSGKSRTAAIAGSYEAVLAGHERKLSRGERGIVMIVSPTRAQSRIVRDYFRAVFHVPLLAAEIESETKEGFELKNGTRIEIAAGSFQSVRGYTLLAAIVDEVCFFGYDADSKVKSDTELIRAIQPSLATTGGKLIAISSPYAPKGWSYSQFRRHFGNNDGDVLVWNAPSRTMNPMLPQSVVDAAMAEDPASARAEYLGQFRDDVAIFLPREVIEAVVVKGRCELPPRNRTAYSAFVDISGGRSDDAALAIAHREGDKIVMDLIRQFKPPFSPDAVVADMCAILYRYSIKRVVGDWYSAEFVKNSFESRGIRYDRSTATDWKNPAAKVTKPKAQLYAELLPRLCSGEIELLDNELMINQLASLERRTRSGGRDIIDHGPNSHDDLANVVAGVADCASHPPVMLDSFLLDGSGQSIETTWQRRMAEYESDQREMSLPDDSNGLRDALQRGDVHGSPFSF